MEPVEIHQIEGFDPRNRMFNRNISVYRKERSFSAQLSYEELFLESPHYPTPGEAVRELVKLVVGEKFSRIRTRLNFKGKKYLTELEPWIEF